MVTCVPFPISALLILMYYLAGYKTQPRSRSQQNPAVLGLVWLHVCTLLLRLLLHHAVYIHQVTLDFFC